MKLSNVKISSHISTGALNLQDLKMTDHKKTMTGKCKAWKITDQIAALEIARPGKWRTSHNQQLDSDSVSVTIRRAPTTFSKVITPVYVIGYKCRIQTSTVLHLPHTSPKRHRWQHGWLTANPSWGGNTASKEEAQSAKRCAHMHRQRRVLQTSISTRHQPQFGRSHRGIPVSLRRRRRRRTCPLSTFFISLALCR